MIQQDTIRFGSGLSLRLTTSGISQNLDLSVFAALGLNTQFIQVSPLTSAHIRLGAVSGDAVTNGDVLVVREHPVVLDITGAGFLKYIQSSEGSDFITLVPLDSDMKNSYGSALRPMHQGTRFITTATAAEIDFGFDFPTTTYPEYVYLSTLTQCHVRITYDPATSPATSNTFLLVRENPIIMHTAGVETITVLRNGGVNGEIVVTPLDSIHRRNPAALRVVSTSVNLVSIPVGLSYSLSGLAFPEYVRIQPLGDVLVKLGPGAATTDTMLVTREAPIIMHTKGAITLSYYAASTGGTNFVVTPLESMHPDDI